MEYKNPLIIVESPAKGRTLKQVLGAKYGIKASVGHIRDLPVKTLGVDPEKDFRVTYQISPDKKKIIAELKKAVKTADAVYLATDPDREGEAISWHLREALKIEVPIYRLVFHEFTKPAILHAFENTRSIDMRLVQAQEARRILDRLVGYEISPILWRKLAPGLSAGRVQSVATKLVVEKEWLRHAFKGTRWWDLEAAFSTSGGDEFTAGLVSLGGQRIINGKDFDRASGSLKANKEKALLLQEADATQAAQDLLKNQWTVRSLVEKPSKSHPSPPFTTSTLQQGAANQLGFSARQTMRVAQWLYENGYITYMRTDSTTLSREALGAARGIIKDKFGSAYLPDKARIYKTKVKNAQEAHEAIRPAGSHFKTPDTLKGEGDDRKRLYQLIYNRTLACQMNPALISRTVVEIAGGDAVFRAEGKVIDFPGYLAVYRRSDDTETEGDKTLPALQQGQILDCLSLKPEAHDTKPPARYTEATLVKEMEALGIGRPSTYASTMETIQRREYVVKKGNKLIPTFTAVAVVRLMEANFTELVDYQFTARMEDVLDEISLGEEESLPYLRRFYFGGNGDTGLKALLSAPVDIRSICTIPLGSGDDGQPVNIRIGRYGPFLEHGEARTSLDSHIPPADVTLEAATHLLEVGDSFPRELGKDPESGLPVLLKKGRYGIYLQLGDDENKRKQKSLLPGMHHEDANLEVALEILALPREIGKHPESGKPVLADLGRYGPYLKCGATNRSLPSGEDLLTIELQRAVEILNTNTRKGAEVLRELGEHPDSQTAVQIKSGRYGPYITDGSTNVSLKKGESPEEIDLAAAVERLAAKAAAGPSRRRSGRGRARKRKA